MRQNAKLQDDLETKLSDWPMFGKNPQHNAIVNTAIDPKKIEKSWEFVLGEAVISTPIVVGDRLFFCCDDRRFYSLELNTGGELWNLSFDEKMGGSPISLDDILIVPSGNKLYAIDDMEMSRRYYTVQDFERMHISMVNIGIKPIKWEFDANHDINSPTVHRDKIFFSDCEGALYCLSKNGEKIWEFTEGFPISYSSPVIFENLVLYAKPSGTHAIDVENGKQVWNKGDSYTGGYISIFNKKVYSPTRGKGQVNCFDVKTGEEVWTYQDKYSTHIDNGLVLVYDGVVYIGGEAWVGGEHGHTAWALRAIDDNSGKELWRIETNLHAPSSPVLIGDMIYIVMDKQLKVLDPKKGTVKTVSHVNSPSEGIVVSQRNNMIFLGTVGHPRYRGLEYLPRMYAFSENPTKESGKQVNLLGIQVIENGS